MQKSLDNYLEAADGAGSVLAHAKLLIKLARLYQRIVPAHLGQVSRLANYKTGIIVILADSGAVAAKLKQMAPTLATRLREGGVECNGVEVKVQAFKTDRQSSTSTMKPLSMNASRNLEGLRDALPDSPLREALVTLLERAVRSE